MTYVETINKTLRPKQKRQPLVLDLFAGCGGMALGFEAAGFETLGFEMEPSCVATYNANLKGKCVEVRLALGQEYPPAEVIVGGPPCQPFSVGGHQHGLKDSRDGFPIFIDAVRRLNPDLLLFENVRGLLYRNRWYLQQIQKELQKLGYIVEAELLNAVNHGVPQNRERLIVVGHRGEFQYPMKESRRITAGEALGKLAEEIPPGAKFLTPSMDKYVANYERASCCVRPRDLHLNRPSRTVTCRNLAGATGDMLRVRLPDGRRRRLNVREGARLQSFPDWFKFAGSEEKQFNQVGNAVPPLLGYQLARAVRTYLDSDVRYTPKEIAAMRRGQLELFTA